MYYARINSKNELVDIQPSIMLADEYGSSDVQNIEVSEEYWNNWKKYGEGYYAFINDEVVVSPEWESIQLERAKQDRIAENDRLRDEKLNGGVEYQGVLFDSDTDQKVNLLATVSAMSDTDTLTWYGMDNKALLCSKEDLVNIGGLITELHSYCWNMNAYVKERIEQAETVEELEEIIINYDKL